MIKINLTEEIIKILPLVKITKDVYAEKLVSPPIPTQWDFKIDPKDMFWGGTVMENFMQAWGTYKDHVTNGEFEDKIWSKELEAKAWETYDYIVDNLDDIISIIFYTLPNVKPGVYKRRKKEPGIWEYSPID